MKKLLIGLMCLLMAMVVGCSTETDNSPEKIATEYLNGVTEQNFDVMDKYSIVEYEKILKPMIEEFARKQSLTEAEVYERILDGEDVEKMPTTLEEYKKIYIEIFKKKLEKEYGENYSVNATIISSTDIENDDKAEMLEEASNYYDRYNIVISDIVDFSEIREIKKIKCKVYVQGTKETTEDFSVYVVKIHNQWKVLNIGMGV